MSHRMIMTCLAALLAAGSVLAQPVMPAANLAATAPRTDRNMTMDGKVFVGYQGWALPLRPEDNARWVHYGRDNQFRPGDVTVEMWPDTSDLSADERVPTDFRNRDGSVATVFDPQNAATVNRHFAWMKQYGIDGAFLQRFVNPAADDRIRPSLDRVMANVRAASKTNGVAWGLMYDLSGVGAADIYPKVSTDWKRLVDAHIREDPFYIHHRGKPVVVLWGIGFGDNRPAPREYLSLIQWLKNDPVYGGNTVILGVPFYWRSGDRDAVNDPALKEVILAADVIAPWPVGRYSTPGGAVDLARTQRAPDAQWAADNGRDYLPGIFPGFSWYNLMKTRGEDHPFNQIPRLGGRFLWTQAVSAQRAGAKMLYVAMFDEIDEGTAIFKVSNDPPVSETPFLTYEGLPSDHYLWLTGQIGRMLRGEIPATDEMPTRAPVTPVAEPANAAPPNPEAPTVPTPNRVVFPRAFAPAEGIVAPPEKPFRQELCLNGSWQFQPVGVPGDFRRDTGTPPDLPMPSAGSWETTRIKIPSPWNVNTWGNGRNVGPGTDRPYTTDSVYFPSYPASWDGVEMGWLRRSFRVPANWGARRMVLHFEGVAGEAQVFVNGQRAGSHFDSFLPFDLDVTSLVKSDGDNELLVGVRKSSLFNRVSADYPSNQARTYPNGSNMDNLVGIWNDVSLLGLPAVRVDDAFVQPLVDQGILKTDVTLRNDTAQPQTVQVAGSVQPWINMAGTDVLSAPEPKWRLGPPTLTMPAQTVTIPPGGTANLTFSQSVGDRLRFWTPTTPNLYGLVLKVSNAATTLDSRYTRFGWRQFKIQGRDLLLNGTKIQLTGDLLHPFGPFIGSRRYVWAFYKMIKDVGGNAVRPHAQPRPRHYLDLADEMGICVLDEAAIFGSSISLNLKEPVTWERLSAHLDNLVRRDRNHPSVFGWSTGNEMFALFFHTSDADKAAEYRQLQELALRPRALDPTRDWISVDGDEDLNGVLPTWSRHTGIGVPTLPDVDKPLMVGEHGGTYYADPPLLAPLAGERAYENYAGRNEGLAIDVYRMVTQVARPHLAYFSPSELAWFGIEHLPLGYHTDLRPPSGLDGIFFGPYVEGQPGIQVERIPPYSMTFNPGFDSALPLYKPLPMFEAMRAALDPRGPQPSPWSAPVQAPPRSQPPASNDITSVAFLGDRGGPLFRTLYLLGVPIAGEIETAAASLLIVDGEHLSAADAARVGPIATTIQGRGGTVWVMVRDRGAALPQLRGLFPQELEVTTRRASSLLRGTDDPRVNGFDLSALYFVEEPGDQYIQKCGLGGPLVQAGRTLLTASNTDWTLFHQHGEVEKCSNVLIYEHLRKPSGAALVEVPQGAGKLWISALDYQPATPRFRTFWRQLLQNAGIKLGEPPVTDIVASARNDEGTDWRYTTDTPAPNWLQPDFDAAAWKTGRGGFGVQVPNSHPHTEWHTSDIWLRREFTLQTLPQTLTLEVHHDEDVEIYLNGTQIFAEHGFVTDYKDIPLGEDALKLLRTGRNVLAVHCLQTAGGQYVDVGLSQAAAIPGATQRAHDLLLDGPLAQ